MTRRSSSIASWWPRMPTRRWRFSPIRVLRQRSILGAFQYSRNETWLHTDTTLLPEAERAQASWNFLLPACVGPIEHAVVSYDMNRLQGVPSTQAAYRHPQRNGPHRSRASPGSDDV